MACNQKGSKQAGTTGQEQDSSRQKNASIRTACALSEIVYCNDPSMRLDKYMPGWKIVWDPEAIDGNYAFIATDGTSYALAIRGSLIEFSWAAFDNWIYNDLNVASQKDWDHTNNISGARISEGTYEGWQNLNKLKDKRTGKSLISFLQTNAADKKPLLITGHSLGGNLATVYASYLWKMTNNDINVITFAAPAAGNRAFADDFNTKFPNSLRIENTNDIVPKFPVSEKVAGLGSLYSLAPAASQIDVGYKNVTVKLDKVFKTLSTALELLRITNGISPYVQTNGVGNLVTIKLSGNNRKNEALDWFAEAGYQHGVERYAAALGAPVINCDAK